MARQEASVLSEQTDGSAATTALGKKIVIVGSGLAGLQTCRALKRRGFSNITVLEEADEIRCEASHKGLALQVTWDEVQLPEFPLPATLSPSGQYPTRGEMQQYAQAYAKTFGLEEHVQCRARLVNLAPAKARTWTVTYVHTKTKEQTRLLAHFVVVCTGTQATPNMPSYPGLTDFRGAVLHSSEFRDLSLLRGRHVVLVGSGRAPPDLVVECAAAANATSVSLLNRRVHWPALYSLAPGVPMKWLLHSRVGRSLGTQVPYYTATTARRVVKTMMKPFKAAAWWAIKKRLVSLLPGKLDLNMEPPETDLHWGGHHEEQLWHSIVEGWVRKSVSSTSTARWLTAASNLKLSCVPLCRGKLVSMEGRIRYLKPNAIVLDTGIELSADLIIMCTGFASSLKFLDPRVTLKLQLEEDGLFLWRHMIHPEVKNLAFVGCAVTSSNYALTTALQAEWLAAALTQQVELPSSSAMAADIRSQRRWRRTAIKPQGNRAGLLMPYTQDYHDQLLQDMKINPRRKGWNLLAECFAPFSAADYAELVGGPNAAAFRVQPALVTPLSVIGPDDTHGKVDSWHTCTDYSVRHGNGRLQYKKRAVENLLMSHNSMHSNITSPESAPTSPRHHEGSSHHSEACDFPLRSSGGGLQTATCTAWRNPRGEEENVNDNNYEARSLPEPRGTVGDPQSLYHTMHWSDGSRAQSEERTLTAGNNYEAGEQVQHVNATNSISEQFSSRTADAELPTAAPMVPGHSVRRASSTTGATSGTLSRFACLAGTDVMKQNATQPVPRRSQTLSTFAPAFARMSSSSHAGYPVARSPTVLAIGNERSHTEQDFRSAVGTFPPFEPDSTTNRLAVEHGNVSTSVPGASRWEDASSRGPVHMSSVPGAKSACGSVHGSQDEHSAFARVSMARSAGGGFRAKMRRARTFSLDKAHATPASQDDVGQQWELYYSVMRRTSMARNGSVETVDNFEPSRAGQLTAPSWTASRTSADPLFPNSIQDWPESLDSPTARPHAASGPGSAFTARGMGAGDSAAGMTAIRERLMSVHNDLSRPGSPVELMEVLAVPPPCLSSKSMKAMRQQRRGSLSAYPDFRSASGPLTLVPGGGSSLDSVLEMSHTPSNTSLEPSGRSVLYQPPLSGSTELHDPFHEVLWGPSSSTMVGRPAKGFVRGAACPEPLSSAGYAMGMNESYAPGSPRMPNRVDIPFKPSLVEYATPPASPAATLVAAAKIDNVLLQVPELCDLYEDEERRAAHLRGRVTEFIAAPYSMGPPGLTSAMAAEKVFQRILAQGISCTGADSGMHHLRNGIASPGTPGALSSAITSNSVWQPPGAQPMAPMARLSLPGSPYNTKPRSISQVLSHLKHTLKGK